MDGTKRGRCSRTDDVSASMVAGLDDLLAAMRVIDAAYAASGWRTT
jgi:hypothetical protein